MRTRSSAPPPDAAPTDTSVPAAASTSSTPAPATTAPAPATTAAATPTNPAINHQQVLESQVAGLTDLERRVLVAIGLQWADTGVFPKLDTQDLADHTHYATRESANQGWWMLRHNLTVTSLANPVSIDTTPGSGIVTVTTSLNFENTKSELAKTRKAGKAKSKTGTAEAAPEDKPDTEGDDEQSVPESQETPDEEEPEAEFEEMSDEEEPQAETQETPKKKAQTKTTKKAPKKTPKKASKKPPPTSSPAAAQKILAARATADKGKAEGGRKRKAADITEEDAGEVSGSQAPPPATRRSRRGVRFDVPADPEPTVEEAQPTGRRRTPRQRTPVQPVRVSARVAARTEGAERDRSPSPPSPPPNIRPATRDEFDTSVFTNTRPPPLTPEEAMQEQIRGVRRAMYASTTFEAGENFTDPETGEATHVLHANRFGGGLRLGIPRTIARYAHPNGRPLGSYLDLSVAIPNPEFLWGGRGRPPTP